MVMEKGRGGMCSARGGVGVGGVVVRSRKWPPADADEEVKMAVLSRHLITVMASSRPLCGSATSHLL